MIPLLLAQSVVLSGATLHSMDPAAGPDGTPPVVDLVIQDGRILALGPVGSVEVPADARRIDVSGKHLVPGLIDGMIHHDPDHDLLYLSAGVTTARDAGNQAGRILQERRSEARDLGPGPALWVAGPVLDGDPPSTTEAVVLRDEHEAALKLEKLIELGLDYLSIQEGLPISAWETTLEVAHAKGLQVWGPLPYGADLAALLEKGQDGLFGLQGLLPKGLGWHEASLEHVRTAVQQVQGSKLAITPLLGVYARMLEDRDPGEFEWLSPHYEIGWRAEDQGWTAAMRGEVLDATEQALALQQAVLKRLVESGARVIPGSAAPNSWLLPGDALHDELQQWVEAGLEPYDVLRLATSAAADVIGVGEQRGRLAAGMVADLLVVDGDPRDSLDSLRRPAIVVLRGDVLERATLDEKLAGLKASLAKVREELAKPLEVDPPDIPDGDTILAGRAIVEAYGQRVSAESFKVVKTYDGRTAYCTRLRIPDTASKQGSELHLVQRYHEGRLEGFDLRIAGGEDYTVEGRLLGGIMNVQRRLGEIVIESRRAREPISLVDVSSVLSPILVAQQLIEGPSFVLTFRGLDIGTDRWLMQIEDDDHQVKVKTSEGFMVAGFDERGVPLFQVRRTGNTQTNLRVVSVDSFGGPGLGLDPSRVYREIVEATEASAGGVAGEQEAGAAPSTDADSSEAPGDNNPSEEPSESGDQEPADGPSESGDEGRAGELLHSGQKGQSAEPGEAGDGGQSGATKGTRGEVQASDPGETGDAFGANGRSVSTAWSPEAQRVGAGG